MKLYKTLGLTDKQMEETYTKFIILTMGNGRKTTYAEAASNIIEYMKKNNDEQMLTLLVIGTLTAYELSQEGEPCYYAEKETIH